MRLPLAVFTLGTAFAATPAQGQAICQTNWRLSETLRIGSIESKILQMGVSNVEIGPNGLIYITEYQTPHVTVLSPDGAPRGRIGRSGQGPGEFEFGTTGIGWARDTLWVSDTRRIHFFGPDGTEVRQLLAGARVPHAEADYQIRYSIPATDGSLIGFDGDVYGGIRRGFHPLVRLSMDGEFINEIARVVVPGRYIESEEIGIFHSPFESLPFPVIAPDGAEVVLVAQDDPSDPWFDLVRIGVDGDTLLNRRIRTERLPVTRRAAERVMSDYLTFRAENRGQFETATPARVAALIRDLVPVPDYFTPVRRIVGGHDGSIWLLREIGPEGEDRWEVYDPTGELEGVVTIKDGRSATFPREPRLRIVRATRDEVWGATIDELEVPYLHRFSVDRGCE